MLHAVIAMLRLQTAADLLQMVNSPAQEYIMTADIAPAANEFRVPEFSGLLYGAYNELKVLTALSVFENFTGTLLRVRLRVDANLTRNEYSVFSTFSGTAHNSLVVLHAQASDPALNSSVSLINSAESISLANSTVRIESDGGPAVSFLGVFRVGKNIKLADLLVHLDVKLADKVVGVGPVQASFDNLTVRAAVQRCVDFYSVLEAGTMRVNNLTVSARVEHCRNGYAIGTQLSHAQLDNLVIDFYVVFSQNAMSVGRSANSPVRMAFATINFEAYHVSYFGEASNATDAPVAVGFVDYAGDSEMYSGYLNFYLKAREAVHAGGLYYELKKQSFVVQALLSVDFDVISGGDVKAGGLSVMASRLEAEKLALEVSAVLGGADVYYGGICGFNTQYFKVYAVDVVSIVNFAATNRAYVGGLTGETQSSNIMLAELAVVIVNFVATQNGSSRYLRAGGIAGAMHNMSINYALIHCDITVRSDELQVAGLVGYVDNATVELAHVYGSIHLANTVEPSSGGMAGGILVVERLHKMHGVLINVNMTSSAPVDCATIVYSQTVDSLSQFDVISRCQLVSCGRPALSTDTISGFPAIVEINYPTKDFVWQIYSTLLLPAQLYNYNANTSVWMDIGSPAFWVPARVLYPLPSGLYSCSSFSGFSLLQAYPAAAAGECYCLVTRLYNTIDPQIGTIANRFGLCTAGTCVSNCSMRGVFRDFKCICNPGYRGAICELSLCSFANGALAVADSFEYCQCAAGHVFVPMQSYTNYQPRCETECREIECKPHGLCYGGASTFQCLYCATGLTGARCDACIDSGQIPRPGLGCKTACLDCNGTCWFESENCTVSGCAHACSECRPGYADFGGKCLLPCTKCNGTCWFTNGSCGDHELCDYQCESCDIGFIKVENVCRQPCQTCTFGTCWFDAWCAEASHKNCSVACSSCATELHQLPQCTSCAAGFHFVDPDCLETFRGFGGEYYVSNGVITMFRCEEGHKLDGGKCRLRCTTGGCVNGVGCYFADYIPDGTYTCEGCAVGYTGQKCDSCFAGFVYSGGQCKAIIQGLNGDCIYEGDMLLCLSCKQGYSGQLCDKCESGYTQVGLECFETCVGCHGDCYVTPLGLKCGSCWEYHSGDDCTLCVLPYFLEGGVCSRGISVPNGVDCYANHLVTRCKSCINGFYGSVCDSCLSGTFYHNGKCHPVVNDNWCADGVCFRCNSSYVLVEDACLPKCALPECQGNCGLQNAAARCDRCNAGYVLVSGKCYQEVFNDNGACYLKDGQTTCVCRGSAYGSACEQCGGLKVGGVCFEKIQNANGACFANPLDVRQTVCTSCSAAYELPLCETCAFGYAQDSAQKCTLCSPGFTKSGGLCRIESKSSTQGTCFHVGNTLQCDSCKLSYDGSGCFVCSPGYFRYGAYCLNKITEAEGLEVVINDRVNFQCRPEQVSFNCTLCAPGCSFDGQCKKRFAGFPEQCYEEERLARCPQTAVCLLYDTEHFQCEQCAVGDLLVDGQCFGPVRASRGRAAEAVNRGECYFGRETGQLHCVSCESGWALPSCAVCAAGFISCPCSGGMCCCSRVMSAPGLCFESNGGVTCQLCADNHVLNSQARCEKGKLDVLTIAAWSSLACLLLVAAVVLTIVYHAQSRYRRLIFQRRLVHGIKRVSVKMLLYALAQVVSVVIALQDVYINEFSMQMAVNLASSLPFFLFFIGASFPRLGGYAFQRAPDFWLFAAGAALELGFYLVHYYLVPSSFGFSETFYKLATPSASFMLFVFLQRKRYTGMQKTGFFIALSVPMLIYLSATIADSLGVYYFNQDTYLTILVGFFCVVVIEAVLCCQYYVTDIVLGRYSEMETVMRLASGQFVASAIFFLYTPQAYFDAMRSAQAFLFCFLTQIVINVISVVIMSNISVIEYQINIITSAIWVGLIEAIGDFVVSKQNQLAISPVSLVLAALQTVFVVAGLVIFLRFENGLFARANTRVKEEEDDYNFVVDLSTYLKQQRMTFQTGLLFSQSRTTRAKVRKLSPLSEEQILWQSA